MSSVAYQSVAPPTDPITGRARSYAVDIMKGIAICLVTYGHTMQGMEFRGWWGGPRYLFTEYFVYSFHMPVFFFTAGLFVTGSLDRRGSRDFTQEKLRTILYPYLLWAFLYAILEPFITRFKNVHHPFELHGFVMSLLGGKEGWFLYALFGCLMLAMLMRSWPAWIRVAVGFVAGVVTPDGLPVIGMIAHEFCFLAIGMWIGKRFSLLSRESTVKLAAGFLAVTLFQVFAIVRFGEPNNWSYILMGLIGTAGVALLSQAIEPTKVGKFFGWLGRASLGIFLIAAFVQGAAREFLLRVMHIQGFWSQLLVPTVASTIIPALVWYQQDRLRLSWLFRWPFDKGSPGFSATREVA